MARFESGWLKSWREAWAKDLGQNVYLWAIWNALLHMATWKESQVIWRGKQRVLPPGSVVFGITELSVRWDCSKSVVKKWLHYLDDTGRIVLESCPRGSLATICNWEIYQAEIQEACPPRDHGENTASTPREHGENLSEESKKERRKEGKKEYPVYPLSPQLVTNGDAECLIERASPELQQDWITLYGAEKIKREALKAAAWLKANPKKKRPDKARFLGNWLSKGDKNQLGGGQVPQTRFKTKDDIRSENNLSLLEKLHAAANE